MYYEKVMHWSTHLELKLEHLYEIIKQFIKITEYSREGKLHPSTISKAQLQEEITEIHTKMEDYEFPIHTLEWNYFHKWAKRTLKLNPENY